MLLMCHQSNSLPHIFVNILYSKVFFFSVKKKKNFFLRRLYSKVGSSIGIIYLLCCGTNCLHYHTRLCKKKKKKIIFKIINSFGILLILNKY